MGGTLLVLGARRTQKPAIIAAKEMGLRVIAVDPLPDAIGFGYADEAEVFDLANVDACLEIARRNRVNGVMTLAADYPVPTVGAICEEMGLPGLNRDSAILSTNKLQMRRALGAAGLPCPAYLQATRLVEARAARERLGGEVIVKPTVSHGGRGITLVAADASIGKLDAAFVRARDASRNDGVLVEEFVNGPEFSVEALTFEGETHVIGVTDKQTSGPPYYVELGHSQPSRRPQSDIEALSAIAIDGVRALGIDWAGSHTEIRIGEKGPQIMEIGARLGGGFIATDLIPLSTGVEMVECAIQLAFGQRPDLRHRWSRAAAVQFMTAAPGVVQRVEGLSRAKRNPCLDSIEVYVKPGDEVTQLVDATGRIGHVICSSESIESAVECTKKASQDVAVMTRS